MLIRPKQGILDPQGEAVERALEHLGFSVSGARVGKVVDLEVDGDDETAARDQVEVDLVAREQAARDQQAHHQEAQSPAVQDPEDLKVGREVEAVSLEATNNAGP